MSVAVHISISGEGGAIPRRVLGVLAPARLLPVVGRAGVNVEQRHLRALNQARPNGLGGRGTNYYAAAARGTSYSVQPDGVTISINQIGIALHYYGGTVRPRAAKYLTIPAAPEAHGKRARDFGDLEVVFGREGRPIALARKARGKRGFGTILFRLVKSVTQRPDPTTIAPRSELIAGVTTAIRSSVERATRRATPRPAS